jgi:hypothetical protein
MFSRRSSATVTVLLVTSLFASACNSDTHAQKTDKRPVVDQPPYWCQLVSRDSLNRVTGASGQEMHQLSGINILQPYSLCEVQNRTQEPLITTLATGERAKYLADDEYRRPRSRIALPQNLGRAAYAPLDGHTAYTVFSETYCGKRRIWIEVSVRPIAKGRDLATDLVTLLQIAQTRYAKLAGCSISPRGSASSAPPK